MNLDFLTERYPEAIDRINKAIEKSKNNEMLPHYIGFLALDNVNVALYKMYVECNFDSARYCFYKASMCDAYGFRFYNTLMHTSIYSICYAIISDNESSINLYKNIRPKKINEDFIGHHFNTAIQAVLKKDNELLNKAILGLEKETKNKKWLSYLGCASVFKGIQNEDKMEIEKGLNELLKTHNKRDGHEFIKKYFSIEITALAKLAWRLNIEVNIDSVLVPKEMLRIKKLDKYEDYFFFKEIEA